MNILYALIMLLMLPQCGGSIQPKKTFNPVQRQTKNRIQLTPHWNQCKNMLTIDETIKQGVTVEEAIALGIENNDALQATFEEIGISKADLVQAGFYANPHLETIFRIPQQTGDQTNVELLLNFKLSDVWQVPLRKKVAQSELERKTFAVVNAILMLRAEIQKQYATSTYRKEILQITQDIVDRLNTLRHEIYQRYEFGYASDLDKHRIDMKMGIWRAKVIDAQSMLLKAYTMLHELLGARVSIDAIPLLDHLQPQPITQSLFELESYALTTHPRILMEQATIARAHHAISYEKSRIFDDVEIGLAYERELEKGKSGIGPALSLTIPFFDLNYGNIEHAKFELKQAEKMLCAHQRELHKQLLVHYSLYQSYCKQIAEYETTVLPAAAQAIEYSKTFSDRMQINTLILLETEIGFYEQKMKLAELTHQSIIHYIDLEQTVGAALVRLQTSEVV